MTENNARIPINMTEPVDLNLKMESYTIIGNADAIYNKGYADGEAKGFEQGYKDGTEDGISKGYDTGFNEGKEAGREIGFVEGKNAGLSEGYEVGYAEGLAQRKYETWTLTLADGTTVEKEIALL